MKRLVVLMAVMLCAVAGCDKKDKEGATGGGSSSGSGGGGSVNTGVAECDEYITKFEACIGKMDPAAKAAAEPGFKTQRESFKQAASTAAGKEALKTQCKSLIDAMKQNPACK